MTTGRGAGTIGAMMEPQDITRYHRHAAALAQKANDPEGLAQMLEIVEEFQRQAGLAAQRLNRGDGLSNGGFSWAALGKPLGLTRQAAQERLTRWASR